MTGNAASDAAARTGNPTVLRAQAQTWEAFAANLSNHRADLQSVLARAQRQSDWNGPAEAAFRDATSGAPDRIGALSDLSKQMAQALDQHSSEQKQISEIIKEIAVYIAVLLAYIAAAAFVPALVAIAEAHIAVLVTHSSRLLALLGQILSTLTRWLASVRATVQRLAQLSWRGESASFGYGRALVEGFRDLGIDLAATSTASGITGKKIDPASLFTNAAIGFGVGGVFGGIIGSGVVRKRTDSGDISRRSDGTPEFRTFGHQIDAAVQSPARSWRDRRHRTTPTAGARSSAPLPGGRDQARDRLGVAWSAAVRSGLRGKPNEHQRLVNEVAIARQRVEHANERFSTAEAGSQRADTHMVRARADFHAARERVNDAEQRLWRAESLLTVYQPSGNQVWLDEASASFQQARTEHVGAAQAATAMRERYEHAVQAFEQARQALDTARREADQAEDVAHSAGGLLAVSDELRAAATQFNMHGSFGDEFRQLWRHNAWRDSFGTAKPWSSVVFYDGLRDMAKGASASSAQSAAGIANGSREPGTMERDVLFGTLAGGVRGVGVGAGSNRAFPDSGMEELLWRTGLKSGDVFVRQEIEGTP